MKYQKLKNIILKNNRGNTPNYEDDENLKSYPIINQSCVQDGYIKFEKVKYNKDSYLNKKGHLKNGDILICSTGGGTAGRVGFWSHDFKNYIVDSHVTLVRLKNHYNSRFIYYYLNSTEGKDYIRKSIKGSTNQEELSNKELNNFIFKYLPLLENQIKIANFLDENCSKIDTEISLLEKKSKLLEEYKQSLIFETVTKGLDKNAKMKDSGVYWIGEIPEHWNVKKLKSIVKTLSKSNIPSGDSEDGPFKFYVSGRKIKSIDKYNLSQKAILLPTGGTFMVHFNDDEKSAYSTDVLPIVSSKKNLDIKYLYYYLYSLEKYFHEKLFYGTGLKHLNRKGLLSEIIYLPHISEQKKITDFLNIETLKIENNINLINKKIELLKEYKQSLIHEAVTGQLEI